MHATVNDFYRKDSRQDFHSNNTVRSNIDIVAGRSSNSTGKTDNTQPC